LRIASGLLALRRAGIGLGHLVKKSLSVASLHRGHAFTLAKSLDCFVDCLKSGTLCDLARVLPIDELLGRLIRPDRLWVG